MRYTTKKEDRAFLAAKFAQLAVKWTVGASCLAYKGAEVTSVASIDGDIITLANGDSLHISKMRSVR